MNSLDDRGVASFQVTTQYMKLETQVSGSVPDGSLVSDWQDEDYLLIFPDCIATHP